MDRGKAHKSNKQHHMTKDIGIKDIAYKCRQCANPCKQLKICQVLYCENYISGGKNAKGKNVKSGSSLRSKEIN